MNKRLLQGHLPLLLVAVLLACALPRPVRAHALQATPPAPPPSPPVLSAEGAVLWDPADERVLFGKTEHVPRPMASLTKIMTALVALEAGAADHTLTVSARADRVGEASLGLRAGQELPVSNVLAGLLVRSGNDAAIAIAEHVAGSEEAFTTRMNARADTLGLAATHFVNASGLTNDPAHRASPLDLARLSQVALRHPDFAAWVAAAELRVAPFGVLVSRNLLLGSYPGADGVKTGNTRLAGWCLVGSATRDGRRLIAVVLGSDSSRQSFAETAALLDYGFTAFARPRPLTEGAVATTVRWAGGGVDAVATAALAATVPSASQRTWRVVLDPRVRPPVAAGGHLGVAELLVDGVPARTVPLVAATAATPTRWDEPARAAGGALQDAVRAFVRLHPVERAA